MPTRRNQAAQSTEAVALWHELWERMTKAERQVERQRVVIDRLRELVELAEVERAGREVTE